jgi:hypothetical protein
MAWIGAIQSRLPFLGPPERRDNSQIDGDLDEEFAFHLEMKTRDLMLEGHNAETARGLALACFGNVELIKQRCKRIALEERIMLQRVNFVLMIVVALMVIGVGAQVMITQRHNTVALMDITSQISKMRLDAAAEAKDRGWAAPMQSQLPRAKVVAGDLITLHAFELMNHGEWVQLSRMVEADGNVRFPVVGEFKAEGKTLREIEADIRERANSELNIANPQVNVSSFLNASATSNSSVGSFVYLDGAVTRSGVYALPMTGPLTVRRLIAAAGGVTKEGAGVTVTQIGIDGKPFLKYKAHPFRIDSDADYILSPNDHVHVEPPDIQEETPRGE